MDESHLKALSIFAPHPLERGEIVKNEGLKFVQYTSASSAMEIIRNNEVWMRNTRCMNDFSEIEHGIECLVTSINNETDGSKFKTVFENIFPGIIDEFAYIFDSWLPIFRTRTFIICVSEHLPNEDKYGRLSMWRAYGGSNPVALVLNNTPFLSESDVFKAYTYPVTYRDAENCNVEFGEIAERVENEREFIESLGKDAVISYLFEFCKTMVLCYKHPGFEEEREWRIVYNPDRESSEHVRKSIESINGVPQEVHKIPLIDVPEGNFYGATIPELINTILIGPSDNQIVLRDAFIKLLANAGCAEPENKVRISGIPLRQ